MHDKEPMVKLQVMLKITIITGLLTATIFTGVAFSACPIGMISYWKMEEDASEPGFSGFSDETGKLDNGQCSVTCPTVVEEGMVNNGHFFNGISDGIDIPDKPILDWGISESFSIELWMKKDATVSSFEVLIGRDSTSTSMQWRIGLNNSGQASFSLTSKNGEFVLLEGVKTLDNATWHHIVAVRDAEANEVRLYVDARVEDSAIVQYSSGFESDKSINIGYLNMNPPSALYNGIIDELAIYNRIISENEIKSHYYLSRSYCRINYEKFREADILAQDEPVRIMPLGDSITHDNRSYRWALWTWLENADYLVDFVGSEKQGGGSLPSFDIDHAGFPGIEDEELATLLATGINPVDDEMVSLGNYLEAYPSDIILLHIGTNGLEVNTTGVENILNEIDSFDENITVVLAKIINRVPISSVSSEFNDNVQLLADSRINNGDKIILVDMENGAGFDYRVDDTEPYDDGDMLDPLHPNPTVNPYTIDSGYGKMADVWYETLTEILPLPDDPSGGGDSDSDGDNPLCFIGTISPGPMKIQPQYDLGIRVKTFLRSCSRFLFTDTGCYFHIDEDEFIN